MSTVSERAEQSAGPEADEPRIFLIGHSHAEAIAQAASKRLKGVLPLRYVQLKILEKRIKTAQPGIKRSALHEASLPHICAALSKLGGLGFTLEPHVIPRHVKKRHIYTVMTLRGAEHIMRTLPVSDPLFDFVLPDEPDLPIQDGATVLPYGAIRQHYESIFKETLNQISVYHQLIQHNMYLVDYPPPYSDNGFVKENLYGYIYERHPEGFDLSAPVFRYKVTRVVSDILRKHCESLGIVFMPPPPEMLIEGGYLHPDGYFKDAVHANAAYGSAVVSQILADIESRA